MFNLVGTKQERIPWEPSLISVTTVLVSTQMYNFKCVYFQIHSVAHWLKTKTKIITLDKHLGLTNLLTLTLGSSDFLNFSFFFYNKQTINYLPLCRLTLHSGLIFYRYSLVSLYQLFAASVHSNLSMSVQ